MSYKKNRTVLWEHAQDQNALLHRTASAMQVQDKGGTHSLVVKYSGQVFILIVQAKSEVKAQLHSKAQQ